MNISGYVIVAVCILLVLLVTGLAGYREKRLLKRLTDMLDQAIAGEFTEGDYDESLLSSVETRMVRFLSSSQIAKDSIKTERDNIKTLISDISHQTKTPVSNIMLYTDLLLETELTQEGKALTGALRKQTKKLHFLIGTLIKMSRLESGIICPVPKVNPVPMLLENITEQISPKAEKKKIRLAVNQTECTAFFDAKWTAEVLYNILDNAVKYTPEGGSITIRTQEYQFFCRIDIEDTGIGIAEEEQSKIFSRFYRSEAAAETEGVGVGLYLAREIITSEGGYIRVKSEKGKGSLFYVYLPRQSITEPVK